MKRTNLPNQTKIPDAINCSTSKNYVSIPNDLLRNPTISGKAKALMCILLANKEGWKSCIPAIKLMMKEGETAIRGAIAELEQTGYLLRIRYRDKQTKTWKGSFWAYSDQPGQFNIQANIDVLDKEGMEIYLQEKPHRGFPHVGFPHMANPGIIILNIKKTKNKEEVSTTSHDLETTPKIKTITPKLFERFWTLYPKKARKGEALTTWLRICNRQEPAPTWTEVKKAIRAQKETDQWCKGFIPAPSVWLNQRRWLDDPAEMKDWKNETPKPTPLPTPKEIIRKYFKDKDPLYIANFHDTYFKEVLGLMPQENPSMLANQITSLHDWVRNNRTNGIEQSLTTTQVISFYTQWVAGQSWINNKSPNLYTPESGVFKQFIKNKSEDFGYNIITGKPQN